MDSTMSKEIDAMVTVMGGGKIKEEEVVEEKKEEVKEGVVEKEGEGIIEEKKEEIKEEVVEKKEEIVPDEKDKIIEDLRRKLDEKEEKKVEVKEVKEEPLTFEAQDFIGDLDLDDLTRDKESFNKLLNSIYTKAVEDARKLTSEKVLLSIPDIVKNNINLLSALREASDKFYNDNKDLVPFKKVVATVFEEIAAENPDKKYNELMSLVGPEARKRLELHKKAVEPLDKKPPNLPQKKGSSGKPDSEKPNTSPLQDEIDAMNKTMRR